MTATIFQPRVWMTFCVMPWKSPFHRATSPVTHSVAVNCVFFLRAEQPKTLRKLVSLLSYKKTHFPTQKENLECCSYAAEKNRSKVKNSAAQRTSSFLSRRYVACLIHYVIVNWTFVCIIYYAVVSKYSMALNYDAKHAIFSLFKPKIKSSHIQRMW